MSNVFSFAGICGADAEVRYLPSGTAVLNVNVANNVGYGDKRQTQWIRVALFGKPAEGTLKEYVKKGTHVFVSGELTAREYKANDGSMRTSLDLNANVLDLVGGKRVDADPYAQATSYPASSARPQAPAAQAPGNDNFDAPYDDDIPF
ncbi:MAG: single-stranded DNA-binding protein [Methylobacter sp.]|nr:single-stranded DNA-binding protein [Methylobacter sp.]MDP2098858.1 single-stranded DNA-binding protein [Methylobacter sp.]MDP2428146.1 single-stranded DNA-binding protein [Methylobacter sp.]MDP3054386.1 single-stranded DNA-binding protein [Methylobacter sp.]MDP3362506.1 single-stranded DNA-binding protein [Methylobacter sp.]